MMYNSFDLVSNRAIVRERNNIIMKAWFVGSNPYFVDGMLCIIPELKREMFKLNINYINEPSVQYDLEEEFEYQKNKYENNCTFYNIVIENENGDVEKVYSVITDFGLIEWTENIDEFATYYKVAFKD